MCTKSRAQSECHQSHEGQLAGRRQRQTWGQREAQPEWPAGEGGIPPLVDAILGMLDETAHLAVVSAAGNSLALFMQTLAELSYKAKYEMSTKNNLTFMSAWKQVDYLFIYLYKKKPLLSHFWDV